MLKRFSILTSFIVLLAVVNVVQAQGNLPQPPDPKLYQWVKVVGGLDNPVYITHAGDGSGRLFVLEQGGLISIVKNGTLNPKPFLDVSELIPDDVIRGGYTERGLLGLVFHPDYAKNGLFFIDYTNREGNTVIARYHVKASDPNQADPASVKIILTVKQPYENHKGGQLAFGPDGYLYIGLGDGGSLRDPDGNGQKTSTLLGKILRIDVNADTYTVPPTNPFVGKAEFLPEIWAYGLRNPWRFSFDRATGDLYIGDVGEDKWEEVDFQPAKSHGGENYGWSIYEGKERFSQATPNGDEVMPVAVFGHDEGCAMVSGYVYRGKALPALAGVYFYGDYCYGRIWALYQTASGEWKNSIFSQTGRQISSFGEDEQGEIYMVDYKGIIFRLQAIKPS